METKTEAPEAVEDPAINNIAVLLCPELIATAHKKRVLDLFLVWSVAKAIDSKRSGSGVLATDSLRRIMFQVLPIKQHYTYQKLEQGVDKFWNRPGGRKGHRRIGLWSLSRILKERVIEPDLPPCAPFRVTIGQLREFSDTTGQEGLRAWLLGMVRARHAGARLLSNDAYGAQVGDSRATVQRHRKACRALTTIQNWVCVFKAPSEPHAEWTRARLNEMHGNGMKPYCVVKDDASGFFVARRLPNSYVLADAERAGFRRRPKEIRAFDRRNSANLKDQTYVRNDLDPKKAISKRSRLRESNQTFTVRGYGYLVLGGGLMTARGKVCLWECPRLLRREGESVDEYLARTVATVDSVAPAVDAEGGGEIT
jgi:hypothetical protein